jgi:hypothetical protein
MERSRVKLHGMAARTSLLIQLTLFVSTWAQPPRASEIEHRAITQCAEDGETFSLKDSGDTFVGEHGDLTIGARFTDTIDTTGAIFTFRHGSTVFYRKKIAQLSDPNGWVSVSNNQKSFAINSSNGGASGGWSIDILAEESDGTVRGHSDALSSVIRDFSSRHNCKTRGDNYQSLRWLDPDQLLLAASVYGTSDCGTEMGYTEGYLLQVSTGKILNRYSEAGLLHMPGNCTYNTWRPTIPIKKSH